MARCIAAVCDRLPELLSPQEIQGAADEQALLVAYKRLEGLAQNQSAAVLRGWVVEALSSTFSYISSYNHMYVYIMLIYTIYWISVLFYHIVLSMCSLLFLEGISLFFARKDLSAGSRGARGLHGAVPHRVRQAGGGPLGQDRSRKEQKMVENSLREAERWRRNVKKWVLGTIDLTLVVLGGR